MPPLLTTLLDNSPFLLALLPLVGAVLVLATARMGAEAVRRTALINVLCSCALAIGMVAHFQLPGAPGGGGDSAALADDDDANARSADRPQMDTSLRWLAPAAERRKRSVDRDAGALSTPDVRLAFGVDGLSLWLIAMIPFVMLPALAAAQESDRERPAQFHALLLGGEAGAIAALSARDVVLFAIGLEATLWFCFLLLSGWGGYDRRAAARKFLLYNLVGGLLIVCGLVGLAVVEQRLWSIEIASPLPASFSYKRLVEAGPQEEAGAAPPMIIALARSSAERGDRWLSAGPWIFCALLAGFAIRSGVFPFHTWLTAANVDAGAAASIFLVAVQIKLALYGLLRFVIPLFPDLCLIAAGAIVPICAFGAAYGGLLAIAQNDLRKLATYACVAHTGLCAAGIFSLTEVGIAGSMLLIAAQGLSIALFLSLVGLLERRYRTRDMEPFGGLAVRYPRMAGGLAFAALALAGAPGLGTFLGEMLALLGIHRGFTQNGTHLTRTTAALLASLLVAWALFGVIGRVLRGRFREPGSGTLYASLGESLAARGPVKPADEESVVAIPLPIRPPADPPVTDAPYRDLWPALPLAAALVWLGTLPQFFLDRIEPAVANALAGYPRAAVRAAAADDRPAGGDEHPQFARGGRP